MDPPTTSSTALLHSLTFSSEKSSVAVIEMQVFHVEWQSRSGLLSVHTALLSQIASLQRAWYGS